MDVHDRLNELTALVRSAKAMPMSASCLVNRADLLDILEKLRKQLPANLHHADALLSDREAVLAAGREEAARVLEGARGEREQLIEQTDVLVAARARAATVTMDARAESTRLLADADDYVDRKLAEFEVSLAQLVSQVNNGRLRLTTRREAGLARFEEATGEAAQGEARPDDGLAEVVGESRTGSDPEAVDATAGVLPGAL
jgi:cell division septum initiation protein DivIVA